MRKLLLEVALLAFPPAVFAQTQTALAQENQVSSSTQSHATGVDSVKEDSSKYWKRFSLQEVTVKAQRKLIKNDIDRLSYDSAYFGFTDKGEVSGFYQYTDNKEKIFFDGVGLIWKVRPDGKLFLQFNSPQEMDQYLYHKIK